MSLQTTEEAIKLADKIGYPVMIKVCLYGMFHFKNYVPNHWDYKLRVSEIVFYFTKVDLL